MLIGLIVSVVIANMLATLWPSIRYAAVTAAIVALDPDPTVSSATSLAAAILSGTLIAAATSVLLWPTLGRTRAVHTLRQAVEDCRQLLRLTSWETGAEADRSERAALNARFLGHLETINAQISSTRFEPTLPNGAGLRQAAGAIESLWYSLMIFDRAMLQARGAASSRASASALEEMRRQTEREFDVVIAGLNGQKEPERGAARAAMADARERIGAIPACSRSAFTQAEEAHALSFALAEIDRSLSDLRETVLSSGDAGLPPRQARET